jgi:hypothetical protein
VSEATCLSAAEAVAKDNAELHSGGSTKDALSEAIVALASEHGCYGYRRKYNGVRYMESAFMAAAATC